MARKIIKAKVQVRISGFGGQGVVLSGKLLAEAIAPVFEHVATSASYGPEARGSACKAEVVFSEKFIMYPRVEVADYLVALSQGGYDKYSTSIAPGGVILIDSGHVKPARIRGVRQIDIPATDIAAEHFGNRQNANLIMLGALGNIGGFVTRARLATALKKAGLEKSADAILFGWQAVK